MLQSNYTIKHLIGDRGVVDVSGTAVTIYVVEIDLISVELEALQRGR